MSETKNFRFTCYYPFHLDALKGAPQHQTYGGKFGKAYDYMDIRVHVDPHQLYLAKIEASAILKIQDCGLCYYSGRWWLRPEAPYGIGCRGQPLVPGRDIAHGHHKGFPFGTRFDFEDPNECAAIGIRQTMYIADRFGKTADAAVNMARIDLFVAECIKSIGDIRATVTYPYAGVSQSTVKGGQQCLNILGHKDASGNKLEEDNASGPKTQHAFWAWVNARSVRESDWKRPDNCSLEDPEIFWLLRDDTRKKERNG